MWDHVTIRVADREASKRFYVPLLRVLGHALTHPGAHFDEALGEFILTYDTVRNATEPDALLLEFLSTTYAAAAETGGWDGAALECPIGVPGQVRPL